MYTKKVGSSELRVLASGCPDLTHVDLSGCTGVTDCGVQDLVAGCKKLAHVNASGCPLLTQNLRSLARTP